VRFQRLVVPGLLLAAVACGDATDGDDTATGDPSTDLPSLPDDDDGFGLPIGAACLSDVECAAGDCLAVEGAGGFCTALGCSADEDCEGDAVCTVDPRVSVGKCAPGCTGDEDCGPGLACLTNYRVAACLPPPVAPSMEPMPAAEVPAPLECVAADGAVQVSFDIAAGTTSFMAVPFTLDGSPISVGALDTPTGSAPVGGTLSGIGAALLGFTNPLLVPLFPAADAPTPGTYTLGLDASTEDLCVFVLTESSAGTNLDINLYLVGLDDVTMEDPDLAVVLQTVTDVYAPADLTPRIQQLVRLDAPELAVIDDLDEISAAVALTEPPAGNLLSLNVVLTADFDIPSSGTIGVSSGIPGPAGLHGSGASGVVMTGEFLRLGAAGDPQAGARLTGLVMAHEMGHFMGLFHTTETNGTSTDPIEDTPSCVGVPTFGPDCPDFTNFMFPSASLGATQSTPGQGAVLAANPLSRP
jgi:hypothetical protein